MIRVIEFFGLCSFAVTWLAMGIYLLDVGFLGFALALPLAYFAADLFSGLLHWVCDSFGDSETKIFGPALIKPFREHHKHPQNITTISLCENLGASAIAGSVVLLMVMPIVSANFAFVLLWEFVLFAVLSNLFHRWAHISYGRRPRYIKVLQKAGLVLDSASHGLHHVKPYRVNYCILCGWANQLTNRIPWVKLENQLLKLGVKTNFD